MLTTCRICAGKCALRLTLDADGRVTDVRGDRDDPLTRGYACSKGLHLHEAHESPERLHRPLKRTPRGFVEISLESALDEIASKLGCLVTDHGSASVGAFKGTMAYTNFLASQVMPAFLDALGSPAYYSTMTIDQSAKWVTFERLGGWAAGKDAFEVADVLLLVGANPLLSLATFNFPLQNPARRLRAAKARGLKLIVIDPRRTETARQADHFLQPWPGEDVTVLAGLLHIIFANGLQDTAFCARYTEGLDRLRDAVQHFPPDYVAARAGVAESDLQDAALAFAGRLPDGRAKRGSAASGVGPSMAPHANLSEHLLECLNVVCGRFARAGDLVSNPGVLGPRRPRKAQVIAPRRSYRDMAGRGPGGFGLLFGERMTGALADDILADDPGRLRALIVDGGNPAIAMPGSRHALAALQALELLVVIDPFLTATARLAHYVIPPKMMLERADVGDRDYETIITFEPYGRYSAPVMAPPRGSEAVDDWVVFWELARRLNLTLYLGGAPQDMHARPTSEELIARLLEDSLVPFKELKRVPEGRIFESTPMFVEPRDPGADERFAVAPPDVLAELAALRDTPPWQGQFRFAGRRLRDVQNTMYHHLPSIRKRLPCNEAFLNPLDLARLGMKPADRAVITSRFGQVIAPVQADAALKQGVVSLAHGWGGAGGTGVNSNDLTSGTSGRDPINAMPVMTGFPVSVARAEDSQNQEMPCRVDCAHEGVRSQRGGRDK